MSIYNTIDFDKISTITYSRAANAVRQWIDGRVLEEQALLNHTIGQFKPTRRGCDIGAKNVIEGKTKLFTLHRKGVKQIDKFGSDLAVTLKIASIDFCKTAFFQFKKSKQLETILQKDQLLECLKVNTVFERSFAFVADENRQCIRLKSLVEIDTAFDKTKMTQKANCEDWLTLIQWLEKWLKCEIGKPSDLKQNNEIENLLQGLVVEDEKQENEFNKALDDLLSNFPEYLPAKEWIVINFVDKDLEEKEKELTK